MTAPGPAVDPALRAAWATQAALRDLEPGSVRQVLLAGAPSHAVLSSITSTFAGVRTVVVFEPRVERHRALFDEPIPVERRLQLLASPATGDDLNFSAVSLAAAEVLQSCPNAMRNSVVVTSEPGESMFDNVAETLAMVIDPFASAWADRVLSTNTDGDARACLLRLASRWLNDGDAFRALTTLLALQRLDSSLVVPVELALCWQALECYGSASNCLSGAELPEAVLQETRDQLAAAQAEAHDQDNQRLERNLAHLRSEFPDLAARLEGTRPFAGEIAWIHRAPWIYDRSVSAAVTADYPLLVRDLGHCVECINPPIPVRDWHRRLSNIEHPRSAHAVIGSSSALDGLFAILHNPVSSNLVNWRQVIYLLEPALGVLRRMLEAFDYRELLVRDQLKPYWGHDAARRFVEDFQRHPMRIIPSLRSHLPPGVETGLESVEVHRREVGAIALEKLQASYGEPQLERLLAKLERGEPLRVWGLSSFHTSVLQFVLADLLEAFRKLGHQTELMVEGDTDEYAHGYAVAQSLARFEPDVVVMCDHLRPEMANILPRDLPTLTWILDDMPNLRDPRVIAELSPTDISLALTSEWVELYRSLGHANVIYLPFAASPERCRTEEHIEPIDAVAFVTHLCHPSDPARAPGFFERLRRTLSQSSHATWDLDAQRDLIEQTLDELGLTLDASEREALHYRALLLTRDLDRISVADTLLAAKLPVELYGRGWSDIERFAPYARGVVEPGPELGRLYRGHKVVLHVNQTCNLHVRVLEAISVGGFVLARSAGPLDECADGVASALVLGEELCLYDKADDLVTKVRRAFTDEEWRQAFIQRGQRRVLREHSYAARVQTMLSELRRCVAARLGSSPERLAVG